MSSNNQLIILKKKQFEVHENLCVDNDFKSNKKTLLKKFKKFSDAIRFAKQYCDEYPYVEYGYHICDSCLEGLE